MLQKVLRVGEQFSRKRSDNRSEPKIRRVRVKVARFQAKQAYIHRRPSVILYPNLSHGKDVTPTIKLKEAKDLKDSRNHLPSSLTISSN